MPHLVARHGVGMTPQNDGSLGFAFLSKKGGHVTILRNGKAVTVLRGASAHNFRAEIRGAPIPQQQQLMARITGNYKRGNERLAASHARNRRQDDA